MVDNIKNGTRRALKGLIGFASDGKGGFVLKQGLARGFRRIDPTIDPVEAMSSPPTVTVGTTGAVSAITGAANATVSIAATDTTKTTMAGGPGALTAPATGYVAFTLGNSQNSRYTRLRFQHIGRRFEFRYRPPTGTRHAPSIRVNGKLVSKAALPGILNTGSADHLVLVDFGANAETFGLVFQAISAGGTGFVAGDVGSQLTLVGGTGTAAKLRITAVSGGAVTGVRVDEMGDYTVAPTFPAATTGGTGAGCTISMFRSGRETTIKHRFIEISFPATGYFGGLNVDTNDEVYPWPEALYLPRRAWIGDSYFETFYGDYLEGSFAYQAARRLGDCNDWFFGVSGMGWVGGSSQVSSFPVAIASHIGDADRIVYCLATNDAGQSAAAITAAVTARLNLDLALRPDAIITMIAGFSGIGTTEANAVSAGVAACSDTSRVAFVNATALMSSNFTHKKVSDNTHSSQNGHDILGAEIANLVSQAEATLLAA